MDCDKGMMMAANTFVAILGDAVNLLFPEHREPVDDFLQQRKKKGRFATDVSEHFLCMNILIIDMQFEDMMKFPKRFVENFNMPITSFEEIIVPVEPYLRPKRNTQPIDGISLKEKLAVVLE